MTDTPQITQLSARSIVRRMFEELSDSLDEFSLPDITAQVFARVTSDAALLDRLVEECLRPIIYDIGLGVMSSQRAKRSRAAPIREALASLSAPTSVPAPAPAKREPSAAPATARRRNLARARFDWLRQPVALAPGETIRLRRAMRPDLERAIHFGGQGIVSTRVSLAYYELIREGLASDEQTVAERYTGEHLAGLWQRAERRIAAEDRVIAEVNAKIEAQRQQAAVAAPRATP